MEGINTDRLRWFSAPGPFL